MDQTDTEWPCPILAGNIYLHTPDAILSVSQTSCFTRNLYQDSNNELDLACLKADMQVASLDQRLVDLSASMACGGQTAP